MKWVLNGPCLRFQVCRRIPSLWQNNYYFGAVTAPCHRHMSSSDSLILAKATQEKKKKPFASFQGESVVVLIKLLRSFHCATKTVYKSGLAALWSWPWLHHLLLFEHWSVLQHRVQRKTIHTVAFQYARAPTWKISNRGCQASILFIVVAVWW